MKRKAAGQLQESKAKRVKKALSDEEARKRFRKGLFAPAVLDGYTRAYADSTPYRHAVIEELVDDTLLRAVRREIRENVSFTPKETDIYKIHQSGDLANLDGLEDTALAKLPGLLALRDALYSAAFRDYVSHITGCGALSGRKTDMAINVYTPGCYLLCHDDVIGSRKVSYILYLTDPDTPWQPQWGGALRLFPVAEQAGQASGSDGGGGSGLAKTPAPDPVKSIPPAWNQLSFFAVQPGESFHDVEEVYHADSPAQLQRDGGRVRMAISGWFHIPQPGEDGFVAGAEEALLKNSGLMQLQGNPDQHDRPEANVVRVRGRGNPDGGSGGGKGESNGNTTASDSQDSHGSQEFNEADLEFLLQYLSPTYLTPDTLTGIAAHFRENSSITLPAILNAAFAARLRKDIEERERARADSGATHAPTADWHVARPPHKHRFLYMQQGDAPETSPWHELLNVLLPSMPFRTWLEMATNTTVEAFDLAARRFRRGKDYTLATGHDGEPRLELNLGLTPTQGWGDVEEEEDDDEDGDDEEEEEEGEDEKEDQKEEQKDEKKVPNSTAKGEEKDKKNVSGKEDSDEGDEAEADADADADVDVGGHEVYMAGDDDDTEDAAVYRSSGDDDNILFFQAAAWNKMTIVLRDSGTLRFVKYVSRRAPGDRWDVSATYNIEADDGDSDDGEDDDDDGDQSGEGEGEAADPNAGVLDSSSEEEFKGFSSSEDSDSD